MQNKEYANTWAISQSMIKDFRFKSPKKWKRIHIDRQEDLDKPEESFTFGSLLDTILFTPETLEERFCIVEQKIPSKAIEFICKSCFDYINKYNLEIQDDTLPKEMLPMPYDFANSRDIILQFANEYEDVDTTGKKKKGWNNHWGEDTRISKIIKDGTDYFESLVNSNGRKIITQQANFEAVELRNILHGNIDTQPYFIPKGEVDLNFQMEIFVDYTLEDGKKIPLKGALDILRIDHSNRTIQIIDFKSSYSAYDFINSIKKYGYTLQLSFYDYLLRLWLKQECNDRFCSYTILNPINIVIDKADKIPYIYEYSWQDLSLERDGNRKFLEDLYKTADHNAKIKKGWVDTLEDIGWHYYQNYWDAPRELFENKKIRVNILNT